MDLDEVMRVAGSVRAFRPDPVPQAMVYEMLDAARFAPSGGNRQGWRVVAVTDPERRAALGDLFREGWYGFHAPLFSPDNPTRPNPFADHVQDAPLHLVVFVAARAVTTTIGPLDAHRLVGGASVYPFVQNLVLAIRDRGLGTTLTTVLVPVERKVCQLLDVPQGWHLAAHLPVGWPVGAAPTRLRRSPVEEFATIDSFDGPPVTR